MTGVRALWTDRHGLGLKPSHTCAPGTGSVTGEGGGFNPTLGLGGGVLSGAGRRPVGRGWRR